MEALMSRPLLVRVHLAAAVGAAAIIVTFLASSTVTELIGTPAEVRLLRHGVLLGLPLLIGCLVAVALTGRRLAGRSRAPVVRRKQRRMQLVAAAGLAVLVPCAVVLNYRAMTALEITELAVGAFNLALLTLNFRDGRALARRRRAARRRAALRPGPARAAAGQIVDTGA
jgi:hypothetical protein